MKLRKPATENERILATALFILIIYFALDSILSLFIGDENPTVLRYKLNLSFIASITFGGMFFYWARESYGEPETPVDKADERPQIHKSLSILERALNDDEIVLIDIIRENEGVTQDSLRFRTGYSKSKVSALILNLEKKGIIDRQKLGRTYKIFFSDWLKK